MSQFTKKPHDIEIELVRGCNLKCDFCAIHTIPKEKKFMETDTLMAALSGMRAMDPIRVEFAGRGEPTLHPDFITMIQLVRVCMPQSYILVTSNGIKLTRETAINFFRVGGNCIIVDCYHGTYKKYIERFAGLPIVDFYGGKSDFSPWQRHSVNTKKLVLMGDIGVDTGKRTQRKLNNYAGNMDWERVKKFGMYPLEQPLKKYCVNPFHELNVRWNGDVCLCCRDWKDETVYFNVNEKKISTEWFKNKKMMQNRYLLQNKERSKITQCARCDWHGGFRPGFLPKITKEMLK